MSKRNQIRKRKRYKWRKWADTPPSPNSAQAIFDAFNKAYQSAR